MSTCRVAVWLRDRPTDVPSGLAHRRISRLVLLLVVGTTAYYYKPLVEAFGPDPVFEFALLFGLSFLIGTYLLSPDLDLEDSDPAKSWGIVQVIWRPYARVFKHRGISHTPLIGTLTRVVYLAGIGYVAGAVLQSLMGWGWEISIYDLSRLWTFHVTIVLAGLVASDVVHLVADRFFSK